MQWQITGFNVLERGSSVNVFHFELELSSLTDARQLVGDGFVTPGGEVRINRSTELQRRAALAGLDPQRFLDELRRMLDLRLQLALAAA